MPGLFGEIARRWRERKAVSFAPGFWEALRPPAKSGATVNATSALECTTALACVQAIACGVAMLPLDIYRPRAGGGRDVATDEPLWEFFAGQPNEWQTWPEWIETTLMHAVLCGDGISFINRPNPRGPIRELIPLVPGSVSVEQRQGYDLAYHLVLADGRSLTVGREEVFHLRAPSWNAYSGLDATKLACEAIGLALATEEAHARLHANGARPGGILTTEQRLTREQVDELRAAWQQTQGGLSNAMRTAVLSSGLKWEPMGMTGVDAQHIETRRFQIEEICRAFGVYPAMVGHSDKASTYASAEQFFIANVVYSLGRWTRRFEERIRVDLMTWEERQRRLYAKFSLQALMRGDARTRSDFYSALITLGVLTRNEARGLEDLNPIPGLDEPLRPLNLATQAEAEAALRAREAPPSGTAGGGAGGQDAEGKAAAIAAVARAIGADDPALEHKIGRILSAANEARIRGARDALDTLFHALKTAYARNAVWTLNRVTLGSVRKLKDADKNYVWMPGLANGVPNTILGAPYVECPDMPNEGADAFPIAFGDFRRGYVIVDRIAMTMLRDPFTQATSGNVRFLFRRRMGGAVVLAETMRKLKCAAA